MKSLVRAVLAGVGAVTLAACVDAHADYDDFKSRPFATTVADAAAAPDVPLTACETLQKDSTGTFTFFAACLVTVTGSAFGLAIQQTVTVSDAGAGQLQISFKLLNVHGKTIDDTVSDAVALPPTPIASDCSYALQIGDLTIPQEATTLGGQATAENVRLHGLLETKDQSCAELDGQVTTPIPLSLDTPGDFCIFRRVEPGAALNWPAMSDYACALPGASSLEGGASGDN